MIFTVELHSHANQSHFQNSKDAAQNLFAVPNRREQYYIFSVIMMTMMTMAMMVAVEVVVVVVTTTTMISLVSHLQMLMSAPPGSTDATRGATTPTAATRAHVRWATGSGRITRRVKVLTH